MKRLTNRLIAELLAVLLIMAVSPPGVTAQEQTIVDPEQRRVVLEKLSEQYKPQVDKIYKEVVAHAPDGDRQLLAAATLRMNFEDTPYGFFAGQDKRGENSVNVSVGGVRSLDLCCLAFAMSLLELEDPQWVVNYFAYVRKSNRVRSPFTADPTRAAGIEYKDLKEKTKQFQAGSFESGLSFILGHEAAHLALHHLAIQKPGESRTDWLSRSRKQEAEADMYAIEIVAGMKDTPSGPALAQLAHLMIFQSGLRDLGATHPADHRRISNVAMFVKANIDRFEFGGVPRSAVIDSFTAIEDMSLKIESGELKLEDLDELADGISLESLRVSKQ